MNRPKGQTRICLKILGFGFIRLFVSKRLVSSFLRIQETSLFVSKASLFVSKSPSLRLGSPLFDANQALGRWKGRHRRSRVEAPLTRHAREDADRERKEADKRAQVQRKQAEKAAAAAAAVAARGRQGRGRGRGGGRAPVARRASSRNKAPEPRVEPPPQPSPQPSAPQRSAPRQSTAAESPPRSKRALETPPSLALMKRQLAGMRRAQHLLDAAGLMRMGELEYDIAQRESKMARSGQ